MRMHRIMVSHYSSLSRYFLNALLPSYKNGASAFIKKTFWWYPVQSAMIRSSQLSQLMTESLRWTDTLWSVIVTLGNAVSDQYRWNVLLNGNRVLPRGSAMSCNHVCLIPVMPWSTYECINSPYIWISDETCSPLRLRTRSRPVKQVGLGGLLSILSTHRAGHRAAVDKGQWHRSVRSPGAGHVTGKGVTWLALVLRLEEVGYHIYSPVGVSV